MTWRARIPVGVPLGFFFLGLILLLDGWLVNHLVRQDIQSQQISFLTFFLGLVVLLSLPVLLVVSYQTLSWLSLRYSLDRNGLVIRWLGSRQVIPIRDIQRAIPGDQLEEPEVGRRWGRWPVPGGDKGGAPALGRMRFLPTLPLDRQLVLVTSDQVVAISPSDPEGFLEALASRQALGPNRLLEPELRHASWLSWPLWTDRPARALLGAAFIFNLSLFGYLCARFPGLDLQLPLHFNSLGQADRIGTKAELFALPIIGLIILVTNLLLGLVLYRREKAGSYLLWGAAAAAQTMFWLATFSIV